MPFAAGPCFYPAQFGIARCARGTRRHTYHNRTSTNTRLQNLRILALDHGTVRIGVAISDELRMIAQPLEFVPAEPFAAFVTRLQTILREKPASLILIGMPRNMDGSYGPAAAKVRDFIAALQPLVTVPIKTWDERLTSAQAHRSLKEANVRQKDRKDKIDKMAAAILLQSYLDVATPPTP